MKRKEPNDNSADKLLIKGTEEDFQLWVVFRAFNAGCKHVTGSRCVVEYV